MRKSTILVVDDEYNAREGLAALLDDEGYEVFTAENGEEGLERGCERNPDVILCDLKMPVMDGMAMFEQLKERGSNSSFIVMTAFGTVKTAVNAMQMGAEDYLTKPVDLDELQIVIERTLEKRQLRAETHQLRRRVRDKYCFEKIVGNSHEMQQVFRLLEQVAPATANVLVVGETGTGKELIAEAIHENSDRASGPFIKVNCSALTESLLESELFGHEKGSFTGAHAMRQGKFELADRGTLFLDEIGEIRASTQVKLLRFIQERQFERVGGNDVIQVDVRVIAATNRDLRSAIEDNEFREDLYYRLDVITIEVPPLRQRRGDLPALANRFIEKYSKRHSKDVAELSVEAMARLMSYHWPGNVRELENVVERGIVLARGRTVEAENLPAFLPSAGDAPAEDLPPPIPGATMKEIERYAILRTLEKFDGHRARAAEALGISVRALQYKLKDYGMVKQVGNGGDEPEGDEDASAEPLESPEDQ